MRAAVGVLLTAAIVPLGLGLGLGLGGSADAAPALRPQVQHLSAGTITTSTDPFAADTATFDIRFSCKGAPVGTFLQVEATVTQGDSVGVGFGVNAPGGVRCERGSQVVEMTVYTDPFFPEQTFVPGRATATATVYGCPSGEDEFCDGFIDSKTQSITLR